MKYKHLYCVALIASLTGLSPVTSAENADLEIVYSAKKHPSRIEESTKKIQIITASEIRDSGAMSLEELLTKVSTGMTLSNSGGRGKVIELFMRGGGTNQLLITLNGTRIGSATTGSTPIENIPLEMLDRIEIIYGPVSSVHGSGGIVGSINLYTNTTKRNVVSGSISDNGYQNTNLSTHISFDDTTLNATAGYSYDSGIDAVKINSPYDSRDTDRDGYRNNFYDVSLKTIIGETTELHLNRFSSDTQTEVDGNQSSNSDNTSSGTSATMKSTISRSTDLLFQLSDSRDDALTTLNGTFKSLYQTSRRFFSVSVEKNFEPVATNMIIGVDRQEDKINVNDTSLASSMDKTSRWNNSMFFDLNKTFEDSMLSLSGRREENEQFGLLNSYSAGLTYFFTDSASIQANLGRAFRAPTFNDLYYPYYAYGFMYAGIDSYAGNPNLLPETSLTKTIGFSYRNDDLEFAADVFKTDVSNLIVYSENNPPTATMLNLDNSEINGIEVRLKQKFGGAWKYSLGTSFVDAIDKSTKKNLQNRSRRIHNASISNTSSFGTLSLDGHFQGGRYTNTTNTSRISGYAVWDLGYTVDVNPRLNFKTLVKNLTDKTYDIKENIGTIYASPGRTLYLTAAYSF
jgi:vitamin B12 transporter